jgi:hypothetical protein
MQHRLWIVAQDYDRAIASARRIGLRPSEWDYVDEAGMLPSHRPHVLLLDEYFLHPCWAEIHGRLRAADAVCIPISSVVQTGDFDWANQPH